MTSQVIPLTGGSVNAHQSFTVSMGDYLVGFTLNYVQTGQWSMDLTVDGSAVAYGIMLEPNVDFFGRLSLGIGTLVLVGDDTTLDNLGVDNTLVWTSADE